ncbi:unnamed protein product [Phytomonas sp. EM1]|nr:unnamed protein product [Phytomonas sp. EM1]|eukprot:CCW65098.1 unnamed protein product [Phytomonas sp. isolate EM1]
MNSGSDDEDLVMLGMKTPPPGESAQSPEDGMLPLSSDFSTSSFAGESASPASLPPKGGSVVGPKKKAIRLARRDRVAGPKNEVSPIQSKSG